MFEKQFFETLSSCAAFIGKILLVSRIQMDFVRCKQSGYARLGKMDFQRPVCAAKKRFWPAPCLENEKIHKKVAFDAARFRILPALLKEKSVR